MKYVKKHLRPNKIETFIKNKFKRDKVIKPIIQVRKLTKAEIEVYRGGKSLQPPVLLTKLKDIELPLEKQKSRKKCQTNTSEKSQSENLFTRDTFRLKENVSENYSKKEMEI